MLTFLADARDGSSGSSNACNTCCCATATVRPGETNKWIINYANWVASISGRGLVGVPSFEIKNITPTVAVVGTNIPPTNLDYVATTAFDTALTSNVSASATDANVGDTLTYAHLPLYGPHHGRLTFNTDGTYTYTPLAGYSGYDEFYFTTSDTVNTAIVNKVSLRINPALPAAALALPPVIPALHIPSDRIIIRNPTLQFAVAASPALKTGDIYRINVRQAAMDCEGEPYYHIACFDVTVGKC